MRSGGEKSEPAIYVDRPTEWEQETGNKVKLEPIPGGDPYVPKVMSLGASGTIGDALFTTDNNSEHTFMARNGIIEPADPYLDKNGVTSLADTDPWWDWASWNARLIADEHVHPIGQEVSSGGVAEMFGAEKLAMFHAARSLHYPARLAAKDKFDWMVIQFPRAP